MVRTFDKINPQTPAQQAAYSKWLDQRSDREVARRDRIHGAAGVIPEPLWLVLFFTTAIIIGFLLLFASSSERAVAQAALMGTVVAVIVSTLLLLRFLDNPFHAGFGGLRPVAMERTLRVVDQELATSGRAVSPPCDAQGSPVER